MVRGAGRIRFHENDDPRYLGPSSGIAITRLVMEMAKQHTDSKTIKDVVPELTAQEIKSAFDLESSKPTSKIYPMISSIPQPNLPPRNLTYRLVDVFAVKAQAMLPTLHEPTFRRDVEEVFAGADDPVQNFQLRMVIAISMQKMSTDYAGLADSYYLAALPYLEPALKRMDLRALQCLVLIAQYSMLTPTRTAAYWVVGMAVKLCHDLALTDESTIAADCHNCLEIDMRRRLFWIVMSMEFGLSHSLGRPSCFSVSHDHINVKFFHQVDDKFITPDGLLPDAKPILGKCIAIHFLKMRLLQLEIRRTLYLNKRDAPVSDNDPWFHQMEDKMERWVTSCPKHDGGSGLGETWFRGRLNTMIVFLYRPSPQVPEPSPPSAEKAYKASVFNVAMQREQIATGSIDVTWIFTQSLFMALNTILWSLSYPDIRRDHPIDEVRGHLDVALEAIMLAAQRWPGVESALLLYRSLVAACLKAYNTDESYVVHSPSNPSNHATPSSTQDISPPAMSSPSSTTTSQSHAAMRYNPMDSKAQYAMHPLPPYASSSTTATTATTATSTTSTATTPELNYTGLVNPFNTFPTVVPGLPGWDPNFAMASTTAGHLAYVNAAVDPMMNWNGSIADQYSQYFNEPLPVPDWRGRTLSRQEQVELMASLESDIPDVQTPFMREAFYQP